MCFEGFWWIYDGFNDFGFDFTTFTTVCIFVSFNAKRQTATFFLYIHLIFPSFNRLYLRAMLSVLLIGISDLVKLFTIKCSRKLLLKSIYFNEKKYKSSLFIENNTKTKKQIRLKPFRINLSIDANLIYTRKETLKDIRSLWLSSNKWFIK